MTIGIIFLMLYAFVAFVVGSVMFGISRSGISRAMPLHQPKLVGLWILYLVAGCFWGIYAIVAFYWIVTD